MALTGIGWPFDDFVGYFKDWFGWSEILPKDHERWSAGKIEIDLEGVPPKRPYSSCFVDCDAKEMYVYEDAICDMSPLHVRRICMALMHRFWNGWAMHWAENGYTEILARVGYKLADVRLTVEKLGTRQQKEVFDEILEGFIPHRVQKKNPDYLPHLLEGEIERHTYGFYSLNEEEKGLIMTQENGLIITLKENYRIRDY